jgi:hypothetical protein
MVLASATGPAHLQSLDKSFILIWIKIFAMPETIDLKRVNCRKSSSFWRNLSGEMGL